MKPVRYEQADSEACCWLSPERGTARRRAQPNPVPSGGHPLRLRATTASC